MKVDLFNKVLKILTHVLHPLLPPPVSHTQRYGLRPSVHDRTLPERSSNFVDCNFIIRMLYLNAYWLNNVLFYVTSMLCFTVAYVVALCVKMRYVILCIKRLLIDWLSSKCGECHIISWRRKMNTDLLIFATTELPCIDSAVAVARARHCFTLRYFSSWLFNVYMIVK